MADLTLTGPAEQYVERMGLLWEAEGLPRIAGRMLGLLALQPEPTTLDDIAGALGVSKASVSNDTRLLERLGFVERVSRPGDRKDYYQNSARSFERAIAERLRRMGELQSLIEAGAALAVDSPAVRARLDDHRVAFTHVTAALKSALEEIQAKHRARETTPA
jgi:DNA-binding transcriptional regulator GbsR (MarR family)